MAEHQFEKWSMDKSTDKFVIPQRGTKPSILLGVEDLATTMEAFSEDALTYLSGLTDAEYAADRAHGELNHILGRLNRMRLDLIQLGRQLE